jgi:hypothetical protein
MQYHVLATDHVQFLQTNLVLMGGQRVAGIHFAKWGHFGKWSHLARGVQACQNGVVRSDDRFDHE